MIRDQTTLHDSGKDGTDISHDQAMEDIGNYLDRLDALPEEIRPTHGVLWPTAHLMTDRGDGRSNKSTHRYRWRTPEATKYLVREWKRRSIVPCAYINPWFYAKDLGDVAWREQLYRIQQAQEEMGITGMYLDGRAIGGEPTGNPRIDPTQCKHGREQSLYWMREAKAMFPWLRFVLHDSTTYEPGPAHHEADLWLTGEGRALPTVWGSRVDPMTASNVIVRAAAESAKQHAGPILLAHKSNYSNRQKSFEDQCIASASLGCGVVVHSRQMGGDLYERVAEARRGGQS